jgi:acyl-CoA synthetase (NDP forming)/GNAT superfamily N-acetyltransferase
VSPAATALDDGITLDVLTRDGRIAQIRMVTTEDRAALTALNDRVTLRTRLMRYFSLSDAPGAWYVDRVLRSAQSGGALVAVVDGTVVALASFARLERDPAEADLGILVDDAHQVHGLGALLLEHLAAIARRHGIDTFTADVMLENTRMLRLLRDSGFAVTSTSSHGLAELRVDLSDLPAVWGAVLRRDGEAQHRSLEPLLRPTSIALVGSAREGSVASQVFTSLVSGGFTGSIQRLDPRSRLAELTGAPDLVIVAVPAEHVLAVARGAAAHGARGLLVLSAGFAEEGPTGRQRQDDLLTLCRQAGMRLVGPNCLGIVNTDPAFSLNATFCDAQPRPGSVALISQSGAVGIAALRHAEQRGAGLSLFVSTGNKADVSGNDLIAYLRDDPRTNVIALYLESFGNAQRFARVARSVGVTKPIVVVKAGRTAAGARAGQSHTAAHTTPEIAIEALLHEAGVLRADDLDELFDIVAVLESGRLPRGRRVAVIGNSGGPGVLAADACANAGLLLADLQGQTTTRLAGLLPNGGSTTNPVDLLATVSPVEFAQAIQLVMEDPGVDAVVAVYTPLVRGAEDDYAEALSRAQEAHPDVPLLAAFPGLSWAPSALGQSVPFFEFPERAVKALGRAAAYAQSRSATPEPTQRTAPAGAAQTARDVLAGRPESEGWLSPSEAINLLLAYGIPCSRVLTARGEAAAVTAADALGYPVALKATGPSVVHKTDVGGVALDLTCAEDVRRAYRQVEDRVGAAMTGALLQRMHSSSGRLELLVGLTVDPEVGPLLLVGAGGTLTDLLADRVVRMPPTTPAAALEQLSLLRCAPLFGGYRNQPSLDLDGTVDVLLALGRLARDLPEVLELDINPLLVGHSGVSGLDVRIRVGQPDGHREQPARTLTR